MSHGTSQGQTNHFTSGYSVNSTWQSNAWKESGTKDSTQTGEGSYTSSTTGHYTHTTDSPTGSHSSVSGSTTASYTSDWSLDNDNTMTKVASAASWGTSGGDSYSESTVRSSSTYGGSGTYNDTAAGINIGTIKESGTTSSGTTYDLDKSWETGVWIYCGATTFNDTTTGHWSSTGTGSYNHTTATVADGVTVADSTVTGTTGVTHATDWSGASTEVQRVNASGKKWSVDFGHGDYTNTVADSWSYDGNGTYHNSTDGAMVSGPIKEKQTNGESTTYTAHANWGGTSYVTNSTATGHTTENGFWSSSGTGSYQHDSVIGDRDVTHSTTWDKQGDVAMTCGPTDGTNWHNTGGTGQSTGTTVDAWSYDGTGSAIVDGCEGPVDESGTTSQTDSYSIHLAWNTTTSKWDKTGDKTDTSMDKGHWSFSGTGDYARDLWTVGYGGVIVGATDRTKSNEWSYATTATSEWIPNGGDSHAGAWGDATTITDGSNSSVDSTSSSARGTASIRPSIEYAYYMLNTARGPASITVATTLSQGYSYHSEPGEDGVVTYSGSGDATSTSIDVADTSVSGSIPYTQTDQSEVEEHYTGHWHHDYSTTIATDWTLDDDGSWRAAATTRTGQGNTNDGYSMSYRHLHLSWQDIAPDDNGDPTAIYQAWEGDHGSRCEAAAYSYDHAITQTTDQTGQVAITGSGSRSGDASGARTVYQDNGFSFWHLDDPDNVSSSAASYLEHDATYTYSQGGDLNYTDGQVTGDGTEDGTNVASDSAVSFIWPGHHDMATQSLFSAPGFYWLNDYDDQSVRTYLQPDHSDLGKYFPGGTPCFAADTKVFVLDGEGNPAVENIQDIHKDDKVLSRDQSNPDAPTEYRTVTAVSATPVTSLRILDLQQPNGTVETIRTTDEHPFFVVGLGWTTAKDLQVGQLLVTSDGDMVTVIATRAEAHPEGITVYNMTVEGDHTYFVTDASGDEAVWVHNADAPSVLPAGQGYLPGSDQDPSWVQNWIRNDTNLKGIETDSQTRERLEAVQKQLDGMAAAAQAKRNYFSDYDRAEAEGWSRPTDDDRKWPVYREFAQAQFELGAGHPWAALAHSGVAILEARMIVELFTAAAEVAATHGAAAGRAAAMREMAPAESIAPRQLVQAEDMQGGVSRELYAKLRKATPSQSVRDMVNPPGMKVDPVYDYAVDVLEADHIVSMKEITEMPGFSSLTYEQQKELLNLRDNFLGLGKATNASKGAKSWSEWYGHSKFGPVPYNVRQEMLQLESAARQKIQAEIGRILETK